jgi:AcrR family transcriptional regulator
MGVATGTVVSTRERIVETALRLFSQRGTTGVSMRELADAAGVTVPGVYYHFASKADLIRAIYQQRAERVPFAPLQPAPVQTLIVDQASREFERCIAERAFLQLMQRESVLGDPDAREVGAAVGAEWRERWHETLLLATDLGPGADVRAATDVITTFLWGLFAEYLNWPERSFDHRIRDFARLLGPALADGRP